MSEAAPTDGRDGLAAAEDERWVDDPDWAELGAISDQIREVEEQGRRLQEERKGLYRRLIDRGVPRAAIARKAGLSDMAVKFALDPSAKQGRKKAPAAK